MCICYKASNPVQMPNCYRVNTRLLDRQSILPVYYILRKFPTYPFISAYPFIEFDEKFQPTCLLEPTRLLERWE